jgi:inosine-uridine nucleoside N-ribohydrolase
VSIPILLDCDPGLDDAIALFLALASPELELLAVTVAGGNAGLAKTLPNALALTALAGSAVPVHGGADRPLLGAFTPELSVHGSDGLGGVALPTGSDADPVPAADAIRRALRDSHQPITLVGIAPVTNLALALATEPALAAKVAGIVLMAGAWAEGNWTPAAEFNAWSDPEALAILLACGRPVTLVTLELTAQALVTPARIDALQAAGDGRCLRAACAMLRAWPPSRRFQHRGFPLHDPCAVAWLIAPELFTGRDCAAEIDLGPGPSRGRTVIDRWNRTGAAPNIHLLETLDADAFFALLADRLARLP